MSINLQGAPPGAETVPEVGCRVISTWAVETTVIVKGPSRGDIYFARLRPRGLSRDIVAIPTTQFLWKEERKR